MSSLRHVVGALLYDAVPFEWRLRRDWVTIRHRGEPVTRDAGDRGVRCEWKWASSLHYTRVFPSASRRLLAAALREFPIVLADEHPQRDPEVSFVIGHRGSSRLPHLLLTLRSIAGQRRVPVEGIVVEQSVEQDTRDALPPWVRYVHMPIESAGEPYRRGAAFNFGVRHARGRALVLHDNDIVVPADYAAEVVRQVDRGFDALDLKRFLFYFGADATERALREQRFDAISDDVVQNVRGGSNAITRAAFDAIGGFDETFVGWGGEDSEFWERAETLRASTFAYLPMIHLAHEAQPEKGAGRAAPAVARYHEVAEVPPHERIARLRTLRPLPPGEGTSPPGDGVRG